MVSVPLAGVGVGRARVRGAVIALVTCAAAAPAAAQPSRAPVIEHVSEISRADFLVGVGIGRAKAGRYPLAGIRGDLWSLGEVGLVYGLGDRVALSIRGDAWRILSIREMADTAVPLDPGTADGTTSDAGDFEIALSFAPLGERAGLSAGGLVEVKLPNSDETKGIGPNTTDVTLALLGSWAGGVWRATGALGIGILEAPLETFEQNDVLVYRFEGRVRPTRRLRAFVGVDGRVSTRGHVALGTEDTGEVRARLEWLAGPVLIDGGLAIGVAGVSPEWLWSSGVAWRTGGERRSR